MRSDLLGNFQLATVLKIRGNSRRPKGVIPELRLDSCAFGPPANHPVSVRLAEGEGGQPTSLARHRAEKQTLRVAVQARNLYICLYIFVEVVVGRNLMPFPALFVESNPAAPSLNKIVPHFVARAAPTRANV
jgi:hypothetical protein